MGRVFLRYVNHTQECVAEGPGSEKMPPWHIIIRAWIRRLSKRHPLLHNLPSNDRSPFARLIIYQRPANTTPKKLCYFSGPLEKDQEDSRSNLSYTLHDNIQLRDMRGLEQHLGLDVHGSQLLKHIPRVSLVDSNHEQIQNYLTETLAFLRGLKS